MAKVFFGCSMRGGYDRISREELVRFREIIEKLGYELASKHQTQEFIIQEEEKLTKTAIHDRDYRWLIESDIGIFEISNPSLGVGGEISDMIHLGKPVLCLFRKGFEKEVSAYIQGKKGSMHITTPFECYSYESLEDAREKIRQFAEDNS